MEPPRSGLLDSKQDEVLAFHCCIKTRFIEEGICGGGGRCHGSSPNYPIAVFSTHTPMSEMCSCISNVMSCLVLRHPLISLGFGNLHPHVPIHELRSSLEAFLQVLLPGGETGSDKGEALLGCGTLPVEAPEKVHSGVQNIYLGVQKWQSTSQEGQTLKEK